jgi:transcriptional regulator with XRE-family HTH domain
MVDSESAFTWGRTVEILRHVHHWGRAELAERADLSPSALSHYITGLRNPPDEARVAIERALGVAGWMEEAQVYIGSLRRALEQPLETGGSLKQAAVESAAQFEILLRAGVAALAAPAGKRADREDPEEEDEEED